MTRPHPALVSAALLLALAVAAAHCSNVSGTVPGDAGACTGGDDGGSEGGGGNEGGACSASDTDGIVGGCYAFDLSVDDTAFTPIILKAQNRAQVTLTLTNRGTKPHDFVVQCAAGLPGCSGQSCFSASSSIPAVAPGTSASTTFVTPNGEGIYVFHSDVSGDSEVDVDGSVSGLWGQFVVQ